MKNKKDVIVFGDGVLEVTIGGILDYLKDELIIIGLERPILPIGKKIKNIHKTTADVNTVSRWLFKNPESVQVVIDALEIIKKNLIRMPLYYYKGKK